jgi:hypothetical protein
MVDQVFSYGELGFQEVETSRHLTDVLRRQGFRVETGLSGVPTAWVARWGSGSPVIALGSDVDGIPQASQTPGVAYRRPLVEGAPGHGEGHNAGVPLNVTAAVALKRIMERDKLPAPSCCGRAPPRSWWPARRTSCATACSRTSTPSCSRTCRATSARAGAARATTGS